MATNPFFNNHSSFGEQTLVEDLIIESIKIHGIDLWYIYRSITNRDDVYNEDDMPIFDKARMIEMYIKSVDNFEGEGDFLSKFGLEIRDSVTFTCAIRTFSEEIGYPFNIAKPREGDLIYFPISRNIFEIRHVEPESIFYQLGRLQVYDIKCDLFEFSNERFQTNVKEIDDLFNLIDTSSANTFTELEAQDPFSMNQEIQIESNTILDWTESNPFSEGGDW